MPISVTFAAGDLDYVQKLNDLIAQINLTELSGTFQTIATSHSLNATVDAASLRNTNAGTAATTRLKIGNDLSPNTFTINVFSTTFPGKGGYAEIINQSNAPLILGANGVEKVRITPAGSLLINDTENLKMTQGLTVNQGAADDEVLAFKSSDVAHGVTVHAETDTYAWFKKFDAVAGGLFMAGFSTATVGVSVRAIATTEDATRSVSASGYLLVDSYKASGTGLTVPTANQNVAVFAAGGSVRHILDSDGDSHQDVGTAWTNFDDHDDIALLDEFSYAVSRDDDPIKTAFGGFLRYNREALERAKLVRFNEDGHHFVNMSKLTMAHTGAIRQIGREKADRSELRAFVRRVAEVEQTVKQIQSRGA